MDDVRVLSVRRTMGVGQRDGSALRSPTGDEQEPFAPVSPEPFRDDARQLVRRTIGPKSHVDDARSHQIISKKPEEPIDRVILMTPPV